MRSTKIGESVKTTTDAGSPSTAEAHCSAPYSTSSEGEIHLPLEKYFSMSKNAKPPPETIPAREIQQDKAYSDDGDEKMKTVKPPYSYVALISMAIQNSPGKRLLLNDILDYITNNFPFYRNLENQSWRLTLGANLSRHKCFMKLPAKGGKKRRSHYWALDPKQEVLFTEGNYVYRSQKRPVSYTSATWNPCRPSSTSLSRRPIMTPSYPIMNVNNATSLSLQSPSMLSVPTLALRTIKHAPLLPVHLQAHGQLSSDCSVPSSSVSLELFTYSSSTGTAEIGACSVPQ